MDRRKNCLSKKRSNLKNEYNQIKDIPKLFYQSKSFFRAFKLEGYGFQLENVHVPAELLGVFNGEWLGAAMVVSWTTDVMHRSIRSFNISLRAFDCRPCSGGWVIWTLPRCGGEFGSEVSSLSIGIRSCFIFHMRVHIRERMAQKKRPTRSKIWSLTRQINWRSRSRNGRW